MTAIRPERVLAAFLIFSLFYFSYVYFFPYNQGISDAPAALKAAKDIVYLGALLLLLPAASLRLRWEAWIFVPLFIALVVTSLIHAPQTGLNDQLGQNVKNVAIFVPIYMVMFRLTGEPRDRLTTWTFGILIFAAVSQSLFSFIYDWMGGSLWLGHVFAGLIGNPNSFSLVLNLALCVILAFLPAMGWKTFIASLAFVALISATVLHTTSGSQFAILVFLIIYAAIMMRKQWLRYLAVALVVAGISSVSLPQISSTLYTIGVHNVIKTPAATANVTARPAPPPAKTIAPAAPPPAKAVSSPPAKPPASEKPKTVVSTPEDNTSLSISNRMHDIKLALSVFQSPTDALLGSFSATRFTPMDGQFLVFLYNGGLLTLLVFAIPAAFIYFRSFGDAWAYRDEKTTALHFMVTAFGITFLASRVLMYFPLNFVFFLVCGLLVSRIRKRDEARPFTLWRIVRRTFLWDDPPMNSAWEYSMAHEKMTRLRNGQREFREATGRERDEARDQFDAEAW